MKDRDIIDSFHYSFKSMMSFLKEREDHIVSEHMKELENFASLPLFPIENGAAAQD